MTVEFFKNMPMSMIERRLNFINAKNPSLIKSHLIEQRTIL